MPERNTFKKFKKFYVEILISLLENAINTFYNYNMITGTSSLISGQAPLCNLKVVRTQIKSMPNNSII